MAVTQADVHKPDLSRYYRYRLPALHPGEFSFELAVLRPKLKPLVIDHLVDQLGWVDEQSVLTGSITAHRPEPENPLSLPLVRGDNLRCRCGWDGRLYELWTMRCGAPQFEKDTNTLTVPLQDDMVLLEEGGQDFIFRATQKRPHGYWADEMTREVCRRVGLKPGVMPRGSRRQTPVMRNTSALTFLRAVWKGEKDNSGQSYILRLRNGRMDITTVQRNPIIYTLGRQIQTALFTFKDGTKVPTTVLTGKGQIGNGRGAKKISYTAFDRRVVSALGAVRDTRNYGKVTSHADLRDKVKRDLATGLRMNDTITVTHQGIPFIWRGDGIELDLPQEGYGRDHKFVYCTRADHNVQAGIYTSTFDFVEADPYLGQWQAQEKAKAARAAKRAKRKRAKVAAATANPRKRH